MVWEQIWKRIDLLEEEIYKLKKENKELKRKLQAAQPLRIDKIEYKINELKVDNLSGTLNVGLSTFADEQSLKEIIDRMVKEKSTSLEQSPTQAGDHSDSEPFQSDPLQNGGSTYFDL
jgi:spore germination protein PC